jgi:hypothetical protein
MSTTAIVIIVAVVVVLLVALAALTALRTHRRRGLQSRFGSEYDRTVDEAGSRRAADRELRERTERRNALDVKPLAPEAAARYREQWTMVQARFVDAPAESVGQAHSLLTMAMGERGYPIDDSDERASMLSVDHADVMDHYRAGMDVENQWRREGSADTEALRQAMQHYREVFGRVVGETADVDSTDDDAYPAERDGATESTARRTGSSKPRRS